VDSTNAGGATKFEIGQEAQAAPLRRSFAHKIDKAIAVAARSAEVDAAARARRKTGANVSGRTTTGLLSARARAVTAVDRFLCAVELGDYSSGMLTKGRAGFCKHSPCVVRDRSGHERLFEAREPSAYD